MKHDNFQLYREIGNRRQIYKHTNLTFHTLNEVCIKNQWRTMKNDREGGGSNSNRKGASHQLGRN